MKTHNKNDDRRELWDQSDELLTQLHSLRSIIQNPMEPDFNMLLEFTKNTDKFIQEFTDWRNNIVAYFNMSDNEVKDIQEEMRQLFDKERF